MTQVTEIEHAQLFNTLSQLLIEKTGKKKWQKIKWR